MKKILVLNDDSPLAKHAIDFALVVAGKLKADMLILNVVKIRSNPVNQKAYVKANGENGGYSDNQPDRSDGLQANEDTHEFSPGVTYIDASGFSENELIEFIIKNDALLIVNGMNNLADFTLNSQVVNVRSLLNRINCPVLLVPEGVHAREFERIVYMADLRYCRMQVVKSVCELAEPYGAKFLIAHISADGLPDIEENYCCALFEDTVGKNTRYPELYFNNIRERNIQKAVDVMIHGMNTDLLVLVHHQFHFDEILDTCLNQTFAGQLNIPFLIFPY